MRVYITEQRNQRAHSSGASSLYVALVIPNIQTVLRRNADAFCRVQQRFGMGLGMGAGVAANQAGRAPGISQCLHQWLRKAMWFVGDDTPWQTALLQYVDELGHAWKECSVGANVGGVMRQKSIAQRWKFCFIRINVETQFQQPGRAVRGLQARNLKRERGQVMQAAHMIERSPQVWGCICKGAIQVEKDCPDFC